MADLEFHRANCSACRKGVPCRTLAELGGYLATPRVWRADR